MISEGVLYQDPFLYDEKTIRKYLLFFDNIKTIIPCEIEHYKYNHDFHETCSPIQFDFELYTKINDAAGSEAVDYFVIPEDDRKNLLDDFMNFLCEVTKNPDLHEILKWPDNFKARDHWLLMGEIEAPFVDLLIETKIASVLAHPVLPIKTCMIFDEIIANYLKSKYDFELIATAVADYNIDFLPVQISADELIDIQIVSQIIPDIYIPDLIHKLSLKEFFKIRNELTEHRNAFYCKVKKYKNQINENTKLGKHDEAFALLSEFHERVNISFNSYFSIASKILGKISIEKVNCYLGGIKLVCSGVTEIQSFCDLMLLLINYFNISSKQKINSVGFDYLIELDTKIKTEKMKQLISLQ